MKRLLIFSSIVLFVAACGAPSVSSSATPTVIPATSTTISSTPTTIPPTPTAVPSTPTAVPSTPTPTVSPLPTVTLSPAARALLGVYDRSIGPHGSETWTLVDSGRFKLAVHDEKYIALGTWTVSSGQIVFTEDKAGETDCPGKPGTYKFVMDGKTLIFTLVNDPDCAVRRDDLTAGPWIKEP